MVELLEEAETSTRSRLFNVVWYILLFIVGFIVFFLVTFPYGVLKEAVISEVSQATGFTVRVKELGPSFLVGIDAVGIRASTPDGTAQAELESADVTLSVLHLFIGQATVNVELVSRNKGVLDAQASWSIWQLLKDRNLVPGTIELDAQDFELGGLINLLLHSSSKTANDMIKDLLTQIVFQGNLTGTSKVKLAVDEPIQSTGSVELQLQKAQLDLTNPNLVVARQTFKKALIKANLQGGKLSIDNNSGFETQELKIDLKGSSVLRNPISNSLLDLGIDLKLEGSLKENFGVILSVVGGNEGQLNYKITGSMARPNFNSGG